MSSPLPFFVHLPLYAATGSLLSENFNASWFLLDNYMGIGFEDLKSGMAHLDRELQKRSAGTTSFIKEHVGSFIQCYDTLTDIHSHEPFAGGARTYRSTHMYTQATRAHTRTQAHSHAYALTAAPEAWVIEMLMPTRTQAFCLATTGTSSNIALLPCVLQP